MHFFLFKKKRKKKGCKDSKNFRSTRFKVVYATLNLSLRIDILTNGLINLQHETLRLFQAISTSVSVQVMRKLFPSPPYLPL